MAILIQPRYIVRDGPPFHNGKRSRHQCRLPASSGTYGIYSMVMRAAKIFAFVAVILDCTLVGDISVRSHAPHHNSNPHDGVSCMLRSCLKARIAWGNRLTHWPQAD
jgi:hypothetical protein